MNACKNWIRKKGHIWIENIEQANSNNNEKKKIKNICPCNLWHWYIHVRALYYRFNFNGYCVYEEKNIEFVLIELWCVINCVHNIHINNSSKFGDIEIDLHFSISISISIAMFFYFLFSFAKWFVMGVYVLLFYFYWNCLIYLYKWF